MNSVNLGGNLAPGWGIYLFIYLFSVRLINFLSNRKLSLLKVCITVFYRQTYFCPNTKYSGKKIMWSSADFVRLHTDKEMISL